MLKLIRKVLLVSSLLVLFQQGSSARGLFYKSVASAENFQAAITAIHAEARGYIWVGTMNGLVRFDNSGYRNYSADGQPGSIPGNCIYQICEDSRHGIWVMTDKGSALFNPAEDSFEAVEFDESVQNGDGSAKTFFCAYQFYGGFYAGGVNCIYRYDFEEGVAKVEKSFTTDEPFQIDAIFSDSNRNLILLNKAQGLLTYNPLSGQISRSSVDIRDNHCAYIDSRGRIWRSQFNKGLECYSASGSKLASYTTADSKLTSNIVVDITERNGEIWVSTDGGGICCIEPVSGAFRILSHGTHQICNLPDNSISALHCAPNGDVWAARSEGGVLLIKEMNMRSFLIRPSGIRSDNAADKINCFARTPDGLVWIGTHGSGILRFNPEDETIYSYGQTENLQITSMVYLDNGNILFNGYGDGLYEFNPKNGNISRFFYRDEDLEEYLRYSGNSATLARDDQGNILILGNKAYVYDQKNHKVTEPELTLPHIPEHRVLPVTYSASKYFVCQDNITRWDGHNMQISLIYQAEEGCQLNGASMDPDGIIWIASSRGLIRLVPQTGVGELIECDLFSSANSVISAKDGTIWIGTGSSLFAYLPKKSNFVQFDEIDGVFDNSFDSQAVLSHGDQYIMGGSNGFTIIDPIQSFDNIDIPEFVLSDFFIDGRRVNTSGKITVPYGHKNIQANILVKEDNILRSKSFRFKISGPRGETEITSDSPSFQMGFSLPGKYYIFSSCTLRDGSWSNYEMVCSYFVSNPWYLSWWFILAMFGILLLIVLAVSRFQEAINTEKQKAQSTEDHVKFLLNVSHELKTPLTLIISPLGRIISETDPSDANYSKLKNIYRQAQRMKTLILTVLSAHKIQEGSASLDAEPTNYNAWVKGITENFRDEAEAHNIELKYDMQDNVGLVDIDGQKLENVLTNIMINAFKHSPGDSELVIGTRLSVDGKTCRVFVKDRGPGLEGVDSEKLFSRYYQGITEKTGSGMGLAYAKTIIDLHKGIIAAQNNTDGAGATFYFDVPVNQG